jgi:hypothetical protein
LSIFSLVVFATAYSLSSGGACLPQSQTTTPRQEAVGPEWRVDLHTIIGNPTVGQVHGREREYVGSPKRSLWFLDNTTLVATVVTREEEKVPLLPPHGRSDATLPLRLQAVFLDASTGKITATRNWPSESRYAGVVAVHEGKFITQTGSELSLYDADLGTLKRLSLPFLPEYNWQALQSPTGKNVLFLSTNLKAGTWLWVETDTLQTMRSWEEPRSGWVAIADEKIAMATCEWVFDCEPTVESRGLSTTWETIAPSHGHPHPLFVNNDTLFLSGNPMRLLHFNGKGSPTEDILPGGGAVAIPSVGGHRFVVPVWATKGAVGALDVGGHSVLKNIVLYDAPFNAPSFTLHRKGPVIRDLTLFAPSPDGLQLAILNGNFIEVLRLPPIH